MAEEPDSREPYWQWNAPSDAQAPESSIRRRAAIQFGIMITIAVLLGALLHHRIMACVVLGLAFVVLLSGFFMAPVFRGIERFGRMLATVVTVALTWLLLVPFFYIFFMPAGLILRLRGKDPLHRAWEQERQSYWIDRPAVSDSRYYTRQY